MPNSPDTTPAKLTLFLNTRPGGAELTFERIHSMAEVEDPYALAEILLDLVHEGTLERFVRVESPATRGGIGDFADYLAVPQVLHDPFSDMELTVTPENLRTMYRIKRPA